MSDFNSSLFGDKDLSSIFSKGENQIKSISKKDIAIIGISGSFGKADNLEEFWNALSCGEDMVIPFPKERKDFYKKYVDFCKEKGFFEKDYKHIEYKSGFLKRIDGFDYDYFSISPKEAKLMDPHQRLFLQCALSTIENAGYGGDRIRGTNTGIYVGFSDDFAIAYHNIISLVEPDSLSLALAGNIKSIIASRLAYMFDLKGPSLVVNTACSSTLVAVHLACKALRNQECNMAVAGGVKLYINPPYKESNDVGILSLEGKARTFDNSSDGTGLGEGVGAVMLKPLNRALDDGDHIYAVIKGSYMNQDGNTVGITAPKTDAQTEAILQAWKEAEIDPESISYIEAHGTGTKLGDPIEIKAITQAFRKFTSKNQFCAVGSVKTNIGHLDSSAGIAGLIKVILSLKAKKIPPHLNFTLPNEKIDFEQSPVYVSDRLIDWKSEAFPRRCGISSFGLSGTNCHMVLEEAPENNKISSRDSVNNMIFCLSAKNMSCLKVLVVEYYEFLRKNTKVTLEQICFTAATGREHFDYRIAIIANSLEVLRYKLHSAIERNFEEVKCDGVYINKHKIVPEHKKVRNNGQVTQLELIQKGETAKKFIHKINKGTYDHKFFDSLCNLYVEGASINWISLYMGKKIYKISLPVYPFDNKNCWLDIDSPFSNNNYGNSLIHKCLIETHNIEIYLTIFSPKSHWMLSEHQVNGFNVVPGTTFIEMINNILTSKSKEIVHELCEIIFYHPLIVNDGQTKETHTIITKDGQEDYRFSIVSKDNDGSFIQHTEGRVKIGNSFKIEVYDINEIKRRCNLKESSKYEENHNKIVSTSLRWQTISQMYVGDNEALAFLELNKKYRDDLKEFYFHPSLMDCAVNFANNFIGMGSFLPFYYERLIIYQNMPGGFYSLIKRKDVDNKAGETAKFDVILMLPNGEVFAKIKNYTVKRVHETQFNANYNRFLKGLLHKIDWIEATVVKDKADVENLLIFGIQSKANMELYNVLKSHFNNTIFAEYNEINAKLQENRYGLDYSQESYDMLFSMIDMNKVTHIVFITNSFNIMASSLELRNKSIDALFYMVKSIIKNKINHNIELIIISDPAHKVSGNEQSINPIGAACFGFARTIEAENTNLHCRCIDMDSFTDYKYVIDEIKSLDSSYKIAYRNNIRYVEKISDIALEKHESKNIQMSTKGCYIITGGTGGLGLEVARYLVGKDAKNLCLLSRTGYKKDSSIYTGDYNEAKTEKFLKMTDVISELKQFGADVSVYRVDVSNIEVLEKVLIDLREKYGKINGVIHCAGVAGDGIIANKNITDFNEVVLPKIDGTIALHKLTLKDNLDFFVMFSSISAILGEIGQGDYTAANAFLDAFSLYRNIQNKSACSINWAAWKDTGMAADYGLSDNGLFEMLDTKEAIEVLNLILATDINNVIVGRFNDNELAKYDKSNIFKLEVVKKVDDKTQSLDKVKEQKSNITIMGKEHYSELERIIAQVWCNVMERSEVDIYDNFYNLGGDSIMAIQIVNSLNKVLAKKINISDLFENITIAELAEFLKEQGDNKTKNNDNIRKNYNGRFFDLSNSQKRIWFLQKYEPELTAYNLPSYHFIHEKLDISLLKNALNKMFDRHLMLRTIFVEENGFPMQKILNKYESSIDIVDLSFETDRNNKLHKSILSMNNYIFNLSEPLIKCVLYKMEEEEFCLYFNLHHIIIDGWGIRIFFDELMKLYKSKMYDINNVLKPIKMEYVDWILQQKAWEESSDFKFVEDYWKRELYEPLPKLNLPIDFSRPPVLTYNGKNHILTISKFSTVMFKEMAKKLQTTLHIVLLSAYFLFLSKITGDKDIIVGIPISKRDSEEVEMVIGLFINMLSIRINMEKIDDFKKLVNAVKEKSIKAYKNSAYPFESLVAEINAERDLSRNPIFNTVFQFYEEVPPQNEGVSQFELSFISREVNEAIEIRLEYNSDLFKSNTIESFAGYFINIIDSLTENMEIELKNVKLLKPEEENNLLNKFTNNKCYKFNKSISQLFQDKVLNSPDDICAVFEDQVMTYRELNELSNQLASLLMRQGVLPNTPVGIMLNRNLNLIIGLMGIIKSQGCYVPLDPNYPSSRIQYIMEHSESRILITEKELEDKVYELCNNGYKLDQLINISDFYQQRHENIKRVSTLSDIIKEKKEFSSLSLDFDSIMYIIYTSGSTGMPKGVMVTYKNALNYLMWSIEEFKITHYDSILSVTSVCFDISVFEIFGALISGAKLNIISYDRLLDPMKLLEYINKHRITLWHSVPALMTQLLVAVNEQKNEEMLPCIENIRCIMIGGEAWSVKLAKDIKNSFINAALYNMYGPTEATIWVSYYHINDQLDNLAILPIGKPVAGNSILIMDNDKNICSVGVEGEIFISGKNVTPGYYKSENKTREVFIKDSDGKTIYKTGDLGKYTADGNVEFIGRNDGMVKIRGYRVEIGEIENALYQKEGIEQVAVVTKNVNGINQLICYYTYNNLIDIEDIKDSLRSKLPEYMIPLMFKNIEKMPLTPNGKIDRKFLSEQSIEVIKSNKFVPPASDIERTLVEIWCKVLEVEGVGIDDNFFNIGGNSFMLVQVQAYINSFYKDKISVTDLFKYPTIKKIAEYIEEKENVKTEKKDGVMDLLEQVMSEDIDIDEAIKKLKD